MTPNERTQLLQVLERARELGFLGPGPVEAHFEHALGFADLLPPDARKIADLGSGGGVPGLVIAFGCPHTRLSLIDGKASRCAWLREAVDVLGLGDRVDVVLGEAQTIAHDAQYRRSFDVVVARGFAPASTTAEVACALLTTGGQLIVSDPPEGSGRWDALAKAGLGFGVPAPRSVRGCNFVQVGLDAEPPASAPRKSAAIRKRPLF